MRKLIKICTALVFLLSLGAVIRTGQRWYGERQETAQQVAALELAVNALGDTGRTHYRSLAKWYNYRLAQKAPGLWSTYEQILNLGEGRMAVLEVPELNLKLPVTHGRGGIVGHDVDTSLPTGGRGNHTVLFLSRGYRWEEGMPVFLNCLGSQLAYRVEGLQVMPPNWPTGLPTEAGQDFLTLVYDGKHTRTLVRCVRCQELTVREKQSIGSEAWMVAALPLGLVVPAWLRQVRSERKLQLENSGFSGKKEGNPSYSEITVVKILRLVYNNLDWLLYHNRRIPFLCL